MLISKKLMLVTVDHKEPGAGKVNNNDLIIE